LDQLVQTIRISNLETRLQLNRFVCFAIELEMELAATEQERLILADRWAKATNHCHTLSQALDRLKRE